MGIEPESVIYKPITLPDTLSLQSPNLFLTLDLRNDMQMKLHSLRHYISNKLILVQ